MSLWKGYFLFQFMPDSGENNYNTLALDAAERFTQITEIAKEGLDWEGIVLVIVREDLKEFAKHKTFNDVNLEDFRIPVPFIEKSDIILYRDNEEKNTKFFKNRYGKCFPPVVIF